MSDSSEAVTFDNQLKDSRHSSKVFNNKNHKRTLKSKENYFKPKCNKELKKKLKKYKLRRDGSEDPEVLDVSQILVTSLRIKSPNNPDKISNSNNILEIEDPKPSNYLFKMVRRRKVCAQLKSKIGVNDNILPNGNDIQPTLEDEASQTNKQNAFKMMMESRNKSIGSNSPGKEKCVDETALQEITEKKATKAKRILSLQKMAESKGSLKNKEVEEYREKTIKKKMLKRAELFKEMITKQDKHENKNDSKITSKSNTIPKQPIREMSEKNKNIVQTNKTLKLCDIFSDTNTVINENKQPKQLEKVSDEDIEFLNKLSPSIRKKENMLCYFKKLTKEEDELKSEQNENNCSDESSPVIKIKFTPKRKKKVKSLNFIKEDSDSIAEENNVQKQDLVICNLTKNDKDELTENIESRKRKRNKKVEENISISTMETHNNIESSINENRPKRITKKPVKYTEDVHCFSSDEELHIFTPKKKKNNDNLKLKSNKIVPDDKKPNKDMPTTIKENESILLKKTVKDEKNITKKSSNSTKVDEKKPVKLAPIFLAKPQLSQAALEAKQKFLQSGVPEKLKKNIAPQLNNVISSDNFYPVFHIQQKESYGNHQYSIDWFKVSEELEEEEEEELSCDVNNYSFKSFLTTVTTEVPSFPILKHKPDKILKCMKSAYPKFPVYRTYHRLRSKNKGDFKDVNDTDLDNSVEIIDSCTEVNNDNPEKLNWCDKYKSTSSKQIIGNFESVKELKRWLETWSEKLIKAKTTTGESSDMSDFYSSDIDSRDSMKSSNSVLILTGKTGTGKTSSVYAVAAELAIKVIEVNASSKRNGKIMLQDLQEATQSHKVDRGKSGLECSQKSQEVPPLTYAKKRGRPKKSDDCKPKKLVISHVATESLSQSSNQECVRTGMSLILIDDADIVFDQDDGFCSAISQLIHSSKRPVILVTSSLSCPHLQKFIQNGKILHMRPLIPRMLGTWLDIMCLADVGKCYMGLGERILDNYRGDIRKTINCLQFYMNTYRNAAQMEEVAMSQVRFNIEDENSGMSWADTESLETQKPIENDSYSIDKKLQLLQHSEFNIFDVWWCLNNRFKDVNSEGEELSYIKKNETEKIRKLAEVLNVISMIDYSDLLKEDRKTNVISNPWHCDESASLMETENFDIYNKANFLNLEISDFLLNCTISEGINVFQTGESQSISSMGLYRERDRLVSRHNTLSSYLNPSAILDRRATALDYWSGCRTICRIEKSKTDINIKRNNRFCHYLKSLNVLCRNDFFDNLAVSLS